MDPTTRDRWLEDRRGVLDVRWNRAWAWWITWATAAGLVCSLVQWGWRLPVAVTLTLAGVSAFVALPFRLSRGAGHMVLLVEHDLHAGLVLTGAAGVLAASAPLGLLLVALLVATAPPVRRDIRVMGSILRWSLEASQDPRWDTATSPPDGTDPLSPGG